MNVKRHINCKNIFFYHCETASVGQGLLLLVMHNHTQTHHTW